MIKKYMSVRMVHAEKMNLKEYEKKTGKNPLKDTIGESDYPGYLVTNEAGFARWMKKEIFESQFELADTPKDRMVVELNELTQRLDALQKTLSNSKVFDVVPEAQKGLMISQYHAMCLYGDILSKRLNLLSKNSDR